MDIVKVSQPKNRVDYLDGLRGISILAVVLYHFYSRWEQQEAFKQADWLQQLFLHGDLGVQLFFMISGFVIFMTLEKTNNIISFAYKRWVRLFPLMLISGLAIVLASYVLIYMPMQSTSLMDLIYSLTLTPENYTLEVFKPYGTIDGSWWSLKAEVFFYVLAALCFYIFKDKNLIGVSLFYFYNIIMAYLIVNVIPADVFATNKFLILNSNMLLYFKEYSASWFGWFIIGILAYKYVSLRKLNPENYLTNSANTYKYAGLTVLILWTLMFNDTSASGWFLYPLVAAVFIIPIFSGKIAKMLTNRFLIFFGIISFPLYLMHQNIGIGIGNQIYLWMPFLPAEIVPIISLSSVVLIATLLYKIDVAIKPVLNYTAVRLGLLK